MCVRGVVVPSQSVSVAAEKERKEGRRREKNDDALEGVCSRRCMHCPFVN